MDPRRFLQVAAGISLLLLAVHEFVDYNLYTPTNQLVFAVLAGIFFMPVEKLQRRGRSAASQAQHARFRVAAHARPRARRASCAGPNRESFSCGIPRGR